VNEWISVKDRLPLIGAFVDVRYDVWRYKQKCYTEEGHTVYEGINEYTHKPRFELDDSGEDYKDVTHWKPRPEPPVGQGE